jgi:hypothetical protein
MAVLAAMVEPGGWLGSAAVGLVGAADETNRAAPLAFEALVDRALVVSLSGDEPAPMLLNHSFVRCTALPEDRRFLTVPDWRLLRPNEPAIRRLRALVKSLESST